MIMAAATRAKGDTVESVVAWLDSWRPKLPMWEEADKCPLLALAVG